MPSAAKIFVATDIVLQIPLSGIGTGPGMIVVVPHTPSMDVALLESPPPLQKWAEESFVTVEIASNLLTDSHAAREALSSAVKGIKACSNYDREKSVGIVVYDQNVWKALVSALNTAPAIVAAVLYCCAPFREALPDTPIPCAYHFAGKIAGTLERGSQKIEYEYTNTTSEFFGFPASKEFNYTAEAVSHTRNLEFLKKKIGGPYFDLEAIWEEHTSYEFENRSVPKTMATMVSEPYVNHVPTMTGGIGRKDLTTFYTHHFIYSNPQDTELELISRTKGIDRVCDEFLFKFSHDREVDWLAPGIPPTGRYLRIPFTAIVNIRGDRLYHEHIAWDQGTVLSQLGLMPKYLSFPYALSGGKMPAPGRQFQIRVPVAGDEVAQKLLDRHSVPSNQMFSYSLQEVDL